MAISQTKEGGLTSLELAFLKDLVNQHRMAIGLERDTWLAQDGEYHSEVMEFLDERWKAMRKLDDKLDVLMLAEARRERSE